METAGRALRLLYVEDDAEIAAMTKEVLSEAYLVDHVLDAEGGLRRALATRYDVMLVDRRLPGMDGVALVKAVRTAGLHTPILMLTALGAIPDRVDGLDAGANDYLVKPFDFEELLARLRSLVRGFRVEGTRRQIGDWDFVPASLAVYSFTGLRVALTPTEDAFLQLLSESPDHIFSRDEILGAVFASEEAVSSVDTYVHYIRRKTSPEIIETVRGRGYRAGSPG